MSLPPPLNVRRTQLIKNCFYCNLRVEEDGSSYCDRDPNKGAPWTDLTEGKAISLEAITCDRWEKKTDE